MKFNFRHGTIDPLPTAENVLHENTCKVKISSRQTDTSEVEEFNPSTYLEVSGSFSMSDMMYFSTINPMIARSMDRYPRNQWIALQEGLWHVASNWSLGHVPTENENVFFGRYNVGGCLICGDVTVREFNIEDGAIIEIDVAQNVTINAYSMEIGRNSIINWNNSVVNINNVNVRGRPRDRGFNSHGIIGSLDPRTQLR